MGKRVVWPTYDGASHGSEAVIARGHAGPIKLAITRLCFKVFAFLLLSLLLGFLGNERKGGSREAWSLLLPMDAWHTIFIIEN